MPRLSNETFGGGDTSWLGTTHGIANARTEILDISAFTAGTHYPDGYIPSGTPVAKVGGVLVPYNASDEDGAEVLAGFVLFDQRVVGTADFGVPLLDHGRVIAANVPGTFTAPASQTATTFVFV